MTIAFVGWYYDRDYDSVDAVFEDPNREETNTGYFAYTHIGQHGELRWPPSGRKVSFKTALKRDRSTVEEVLKLYGDVPGVIPALNDIPPEERELYYRYYRRQGTFEKLRVQPYVKRS